MSAWAWRMAPSMFSLAEVRNTWAPKPSRMRRRSVLTHSGMQSCTSYPLAAPIMAMAMPVLPEVGSRMILSLVSSPLSSALVIM